MSRIQLRRDTAANWTSANPILAAGEVGIEYTSDPAITEKVKIGDGVTDWATLPYFASGGGGGGTPDPHAASHADGGSDEISIDASQITTGTIADARIPASITRDTELAAHEADTTNIHGITDTSTLYRASGTDVAVADGGTGASTAANARTNLGLIIGTDVAANTHNHAAGDVNSGTIATARLGSGTANSTTFLRGDQTWATPAGGAAADGPLPFTFHPIDQGLATYLNTANRCAFFRAFGSGTITKIAIQVTQSGGNIEVGIARNAAAGPGAPTTRVATSGSIACPSVGYAEISLGGSVTIDPTRDYFFLGVDTANAAYFVGAGTQGDNNNGWWNGLAYYQDSAFPCPASPSPSLYKVASPIMVGRP